MNARVERIRIVHALVRAGGRDNAVVRMYADVTDAAGAKAEALAIAFPEGPGSGRSEVATLDADPALLVSNLRIVCQARRRSCGYDAGSPVLAVASDGSASAWTVARKIGRDRVAAGDDVPLSDASGRKARLRFLSNWRVRIALGGSALVPVRIVDGPVPGLVPGVADPAALLRSIVRWGGPDAPLRLPRPAAESLVPRDVLERLAR